MHLSGLWQMENLQSTRKSPGKCKLELYSGWGKQKGSHGYMIRMKATEEHNYIYLTIRYLL